jgi:DNA-binding PadR family transcriptional regulator
MFNTKLNYISSSTILHYTKNWNYNENKEQIYKNPPTLKDSLGYRLKRDGYVKGVNVTNKILYSITPKGKTLLTGWIAFIKAID